MRLIILFSCFALSCLYSQSIEKWRNFNTSNSPLTKEWISCFCEDNDGKIYIGSSNNFCPLSGCGIYTYTNKNLTLLNEGDSLESITDMIKTSNGSIIFSTYDCIYTIIQNNIFNLDTLDLIENNIGIISIEVNANGEIFLGTIEGKLLVIREKQIFEFNSGNSVLGKGSIYDLKFYDNVLFIGSNDGLFTLNNNELSAVEGPQYISSFAIDENNFLWIGSYLSGLFVYKDGQVSNVLGNTSVCSIEIDTNNYIWLGGYVSGLLKFDSILKLIVDTLNTFNSDIASNCIQSLFIDVKGNIWIGTFNNGVSIYNENGLTIDSPNEWDFNVIAGVSNATAEYYGRNEVENLIYNQFQIINERFKYAFAKKIVFSVDSIYIFNTNPNLEVFKEHPKYDYLVIYDGFPTKGGGWYGQYNSIHHSWSVDYFGGLFASTATDGLIHEFGHARGAIDLYALEVPDTSNPINNQAYIPEKSIMNYPYGVSLWDQHSINLINFNQANKKIPINYITEAFPQNIEILVVDAGKKPISDVIVKIFPIEWYSKKIDENIFYQYTTNLEGLIKFDEIPFQPNVSGYPWNIRFPNFLIFAENKGSSSFGWLPMTKVQNRYFSGELSIYIDTLSFDSIITSKEVIDKYCDFYLYQNYPNPFNPSTTIKYALPFESSVDITIYNMIGQKIEEFTGGVKEAGYHNITWQPKDLSSGVYFYSINAKSTDGKNDYSKTLKMLYMK